MADGRPPRKQELANRPNSDQNESMKKTGVYKLAEAKAKLGELCDRTLRGVPTRIARGTELFELVHVKRTEIVPASEQELQACYDDPLEIELLNRFGRESI